MTNYAKVKIITGLELLCKLTRHYWCGRIIGLALWLDKRWKTNVLYAASESTKVV